MAREMHAIIEPVTIPEGRRGDWTVKKLTVTPEVSGRTGTAWGRGHVPAGTYTQLCCEGRGVVMSDTPDELIDQLEPVFRARGHVLITGLGIGAVLAAVLKKPEVTMVTVVEAAPDVVAMVAPNYRDDRVEIVTASAFDYEPPVGIRYGMVWHDIWDRITASNLPGMDLLRRRYESYADWQGCWCEWRCQMLAAGLKS